MEKKMENTKISKKDTLSESDELPANSLDDHEDREALLGFRDIGKRMFEAVGVLDDDELMQIATKGGLHGAKIAILGEELVENHKQEIEKKENEIFKLKREKQELENELQKQTVKNNELETKIKQKEEEILRIQDDLDQTKRLLKKIEKELASNQTTHIERERQLKLELNKLNKRVNAITCQLGVKQSSDNIANSELPKLRKKITELKLQVEQVKAKKM